jgi:hypothetical protein
VGSTCTCCNRSGALAGQQRTPPPPRCPAAAAEAGGQGARAAEPLLRCLQDHVCVENSMHQNCAVCFEYLFDSVKAISVMPCGHTIHRDCLQQLYDHRTYTCPICCRTTVDLRSTWQDLDETVRAAALALVMDGLIDGWR